MAGMQMMMLGSSGGVTQNLNCSANSSAAGSGTSTAQVWFNSDGTMNGSQNYGGPFNWYTPAVTGIGAQFWISINGGTWTSLSSTQTTSVTAGNIVVSRSVSIARDSSGSTVVATGTIQLITSNAVYEKITGKQFSESALAKHMRRKG